MIKLYDDCRDILSLDQNHSLKDKDGASEAYGPEEAGPAGHWRTT